MKKLCLAVVLFALSACAFAQQNYVGRYDVFAGYSYLDSPKLSLNQHGFNTQVGVNLTRWLAFGVDYSIQDGNASLVPSDLKTAYATQVDQLILAGQAGYLAPYGVAQLPANYNAYVPFSARTQTFTVGPQLVWRHFKKVGLFVHPSIGAIHEGITLKPHDAFTEFVAGPQGALIQAGILHTTKPSDTTYFYGLGGGADYSLSKHFKIRADAEFVHVYLFSGLLETARNSVRLSIGPAVNFGGNVR